MTTAAPVLADSFGMHDGDIRWGWARRLAEGGISIEEYEERRAALSDDR